MPHIHPIPPIRLGTFRVKGEAVQQAVRDAIQIGYRHIDTAAIYRNEKDIGAIRQETYKNPSGNLNRSDFWITFKLSPYDMKKPRESLLQRLDSLQTEYLDLYLIHWPAVARKASSSPGHKILRLNAWKELNEAKREGRLCQIGVSNFTLQHIQELIDETKYGIQDIFVQMEIHPWYWRDALEIQTRFREKGISIVGLSRVQIVLAWALRKNWVVLVKSENVDHLRQNLETVSLVDMLNPENLAIIDDVSTPEEEEKLCWDPRHIQ